MEDDRVRDLAIYLVDLILHGDTIYLHCWGGHGRTGTVVCIMLHLMYGLSAEQTLYRCQYVHDLRKIPINVGSPQTPAQREQVVRVVRRLQLASQAKAHAAEAEAAAVAAAAAMAAAAAAARVVGRAAVGAGAPAAQPHRPAPMSTRPTPASGSAKEDGGAVGHEPLDAGGAPGKCDEILPAVGTNVDQEQEGGTGNMNMFAHVQQAVLNPRGSSNTPQISHNGATGSQKQAAPSPPSLPRRAGASRLKFRSVKQQKSRATPPEQAEGPQEEPDLTISARTVPGGRPGGPSHSARRPPAYGARKLTNPSAKTNAGEDGGGGRGGPAARGAMPGKVLGGTRTPKEANKGR